MNFVGAVMAAMLAWGGVEGRGQLPPQLASYYAHRFHGRPTASGQRFNMHALTAAHRTLPFGTRLLVTNLLNQRSIIVTITDRGPFIRGRVIDLSHRAAQRLGFLEQGIVPVRLKEIE